MTREEKKATDAVIDPIASARKHLAGMNAAFDEIVRLATPPPPRTCIMAFAGDRWHKSWKKS
jgi:hypothetical protein